MAVLAEPPGLDTLPCGTASDKVYIIAGCESHFHAALFRMEKGATGFPLVLEAMGVICLSNIKRLSLPKPHI